MTQLTPDALMEIGACSREEPHPKFLLATIISPTCTFLTKSLSISSIQCVASSFGSEEFKYLAEIEKLKTQLAEATAEKAESITSRIEEVNSLLSEVSSKKEEIAKLQNGKAGYVYIISNLGSFGDKVFKIGMTRRLVPQDRVDELGSASVPFRFDVHSFIFSEDALTLENKLHLEKR